MGMNQWFYDHPEMVREQKDHRVVIQMLSQETFRTGLMTREKAEKYAITRRRDQYVESCEIEAAQ